MKIKQPKYAIYENVKGLTTKTHKEYFEYILNLMKNAGYYVTWKILNTKEHGIPQNRERVFIICFKDKEDYDNFEFPEKEELKIFLKDILEEEVDEKYYLSKEQINKLIKNGFKEKEISNTIRTGGRSSFDVKHSWDVIKVGNVNPSGKGMNGNVYSVEIMPTITTNKGEGNKILQLDVSQIKREGKPRIYEKVSKCLNTAQGGGHTPLLYQRGRGFNKGGPKKISPSLSSSSWEQNNFLMKDYTIRKLTPKECFRLQGFLQDEINLGGISNSQQYKLAGNGLTITVVGKIFEQMFKKPKGL